MRDSGEPHPADGTADAAVARALRVDDFDFPLPAELIAQRPPPLRGASRLLTLNGVTGEFADRMFVDLPTLIAPGDVLVFNDTRVLKARLHGRKSTGGQVEIMIERILDEHHAMAMMRASHAPQAGALLDLDGGAQVRVVGRDGGFYRLEFLGDTTVQGVLAERGEIPLPPYITRSADGEDERRYQTVYAREPGAVAAPTAGLHFDDAMLQRLRDAGAEVAFLTLHVGAGTFQPVRSRTIEEHVMHRERYELPAATVAAVERARARGGRVTAIGTTSLRALEAAALGGGLRAGAGETALFIRPGFPFRVVDRLLTNFHLPRSTLLMLVAAFAGLDNVLRAYRHAVARRYRFFSYGDAMLIDKGDPYPRDR